jgi:hypothetical protein
MSMNDRERRTLWNFIAGYWYDRPERDLEVVQEAVSDLTTEELDDIIEIMRRALSEPGSRAELSDLVRDGAWIMFDDGVNPPIAWLEGVLRLLETAHVESG